MVKMGYKEIKIKKYIEKFFRKVPHLYGKRNARKHFVPQIMRVVQRYKHRPVLVEQRDE